MTLLLHRQQLLFILLLIKVGGLYGYKIRNYRRKIPLYKNNARKYGSMESKTGLDFDDLIKYSEQLMNDTTAPETLRNKAPLLINNKDELKTIIGNHPNYMVQYTNGPSGIIIYWNDFDYSTKNLTFYSTSIYSGDVPFSNIEISGSGQILPTIRTQNERYFMNTYYGFWDTMSPQQEAQISSSLYMQNKYLG